MNNQVKKRIFKDKNYKAIYFDNKTIRMPIDNNKPILELDYPEFYDVKITNMCSGGCQYCYQDSNDKFGHYPNILNKTIKFFSCMSENERPFQVALGGGNPNEHQDFCTVLSLFSSLGITPNYTTNGIGLTNEVIKSTQAYCGGVAITCHEHLTNIWKEAAWKLHENNIKLNFHNLIKNKEDIQKFIEIFHKWKHMVDYFVLLPLTEIGRAKNLLYDKQEVANLLFSEVEKLSTSQIAFGANYYPYLKNRNNKMELSLYEPEILSKYLDLKNMKVYKSSFNLIEV